MEIVSLPSDSALGDILLSARGISEMTSLGGRFTLASLF
jgi:hypothetical protein